jgi:DtxR family transcriptional regulator, Mn-dependent transcriptional regulator
MEIFKEEILEAIMNAEEYGTCTTDCIEVGISKEKIKSEEIETLINDGLIELNNNKIYFTEKGRSYAIQVVRRHRLAECLMGYVLHIPPETMEKVACEMEHTLLPEVEESICTLLGHPDTAPDGKRVPPGRCCLQKSRTIEKMLINISELEIGEKGKIAYIRPKSHDRLQKLTAFGLVPGQHVKLLQKSPTFCILFDQTEIAIEKEIAEEIYVWKIQEVK